MTVQEKGKAYRYKIKKECLEAYGGAICIGCGYDEVEELTLDHVFNDGAEHRRRIAKEHGWLGMTDPATGKVRGGMPVYQFLRKEDYPDKDRYQILCPTCQMRKRNGKSLAA